MTGDDDLRSTVIAARRGDRNAIASLLVDHLPPLEAFVRVRAGELLLAKETPHDLVQSVCREALADLSQFEYREATQFRSWLFLLATRKILDRAKHHRRDKRDVEREQPACVDASALLSCYASFVTPSQHASAREELSRAERALRELPDAQRDAVAYVKLLGLPYPDVSERMEVSESAVRGLVARGLAAIGDSLV